MISSIDIERLSIALHGVSRGVAEAAIEGLDQELKRRLGNLVGRSFVSGDLGVLRIGPVAGPASLDPAALRALIAERLVFALSQPQAPAQPQQQEPA
ncbi:MAG TPA: hypothetical protein VJS66_09645 [Burkholderiales bacterium]|nr:hypothetical protein [Burkholderiales bacterium]